MFCQRLQQLADANAEVLSELAAHERALGEIVAQAVEQHGDPDIRAAIEGRPIPEQARNVIGMVLDRLDAAAKAAQARDTETMAAIESLNQKLRAAGLGDQCQAYAPQASGGAAEKALQAAIVARTTDASLRAKYLRARGWRMVTAGSWQGYGDLAETVFDISGAMDIQIRRDLEPFSAVLAAL